MNFDSLNNNNEESSLCDRVRIFIKSLIFNVYAPLLLVESIFPFTFKIAFFVIELFQVLNYFFKDQLLPFWFNDSWSASIKNFLGYFMLSPYFSMTSYNTYVIFLYVLSVFFFWIFMSSLYIGITFSQKSKKIMKGFTLTLVKSFNEMLPQVLFLPVFDFFFSFYRCVENENGELVNDLFKNIKCYQSDYILHAFIAGIAFAWFFLYSVLNILCFFENRNKSAAAKVTSDYDFYFLLYKILLEVSFSFLGPFQNIILMGILSTGFMGLFELYNRAFIYYHDFVGRVAISEFSILAWSGIIMVFCKITFEVQFNAYLYIWLIGNLIIIITNFARIRIKYQHFIIDTEAFSKPEIALDFLDNLNFSLSYYKINKDLAIALDGFVEYHKTYCRNLTCPSRREYSTTSIKNANILDHDNASMLLLTHLLNVIYFKALQRFPNCIPLRIRYCIFLLDRMGQKQNALQELLTTQSYKLKFEEEFMVFRLKFLIEKDIFEENSSNQKLEFNELFLRDLIKSIQENIEKSSNLNMEFWTLLSEDYPNLSKLKEIGSKIFLLARSIERSEKILQNLNITIPKIQSLYAKYLLSIMQDRDSSSRVFEKLQETNILKQNKILTVYFSEYFHDSTPIIIISADDKNLGYINQVNLSMSANLGYSRSELMNRKINVLMTNIYANHHDKFIENYMATLEPRTLNKDLDIPVKTKSNYIKKAIILTKVYNTVLQGAQFLALFKFEKTVRQYAYLVIEEQGSILDFSSSCMPLLGLDRKKVSKRKLQIQDLVPEFFESIRGLKTKVGQDLRIHVLERDEKKEDQNKEEEKTLNKISIPEQIMNVQIVNEIRFKHTDLLGYFIRLEAKTQKPLAAASKGNLHVKEMKNEFKLQFDARNKIFVGGVVQKELDADDSDQEAFFKENDDPEVNNGLPAFSNNRDAQGMVELKNPEEANDDGLQEISAQYGKGIRTLRLVQNKVFDVEELKKEENEGDENEGEEDDLEYSALKMMNGNNKGDPISEEDQGDSNGDPQAKYKSLGNFKAFLNNKNSQKLDHIKSLKYLGLIQVLALMLLSILGYFLTKTEMDNRVSDEDFIVLSNRKIAEVMSIVNSINQLYLLNKKWIDSPYYSENKLKQMLDASIQELSTIQTQSDQLSESKCHSLKETDLSVKFQSGNGTFDINQITSQIISKAFSLFSNMNLGSFDDDNMEIAFIRENSLKDYYVALNGVSQNCLDYLNDRLDHMNTLNIIFLLVSSVVLLISWGLMALILFFGILKFEQDILRMFLCLPIEKVKTLVKASEDFHSQFKVGEIDQDDDEGSESRFSVEDENAEEFKVKILKKKRKKYKIETGRYKVVFLYTFMLIVSFEAFFVGFFVFNQNYVKKYSNTLIEFNYTARTFPAFGYYNNLIRQVIIDPSFNSVSEGNLTNSFFMNEIKQFYDSFYSIQSQHQKNMNYYSAYNTYFDNIFSKNTCNQITGSLLDIKCSTFSTAIFTQGLIVALPFFFENERYIVSVWNYLMNNSSARIEDFINVTILFDVNGLSSLQQNMVKLLNLSIVEETNIVCENLVKEAFLILVDQFQNEMVVFTNEIELEMLTLLICFLVFMSTAYCFLWVPFTKSLKRENNEAANLLLMIPLKMIRSSSLLMQEVEEKFK